MIVAKIQQLSMLQIEHLHIPFSEEEEQLVASIPSYVNRRIKSFLVRKIFFLVRQFQQYWIMNWIHV